MKTALDWLIEQMPYEFRANHTQEIFKQAKEKEKEQIENAYWDGGQDVPTNGDRCQEYYNQTYNNEKD